MNMMTMLENSENAEIEAQDGNADQEDHEHAAKMRIVRMMKMM